MLKRTILFTLCLLSIAVFGQDPYFIPINTYSGLPSNAVYDMHQDKNGFIWIASDRGLCRYDGYGFREYYLEEQTSKAGSDIIEDQWGRIWYTNFDGYLFYVENDKMHAFPQNEPGGYFHYGISGNRLFVVQKNGIDVFDIRTQKRIKTFAVKTELICGTALTEAGFISLGSQSMLITPKLQLVKIPTMGLPDSDMPASVTKGKNAIGFGVSKINYKKTCYTVNSNGITPRFRLSFDGIIQSTSYSDNTYWFCTQDGVFAYNEAGVPQNNGAAYFKGSSISKVIKDREGSLWFSTTNNGIYFVPNQTTVFHKTTFQPFRIATSSKGVLLFDKQARAYQWDKSSGTFITRNPFPVKSVVHQIFYDSLSDVQFTAGSNYEVRNNKGQLLTEQIIAVKDIVRIDDKYFAIAVSGFAGLMTLEPHRKSKLDGITSHLFKHPEYPGFYSFMNGSRAKSLAYDRPNNLLYFSTSSGLFVFQNGKIDQLLLQGKKVFLKQLKQTGNTCFGIDDNGQLYEIKGRKIQLSRFNNAIPEHFHTNALKFPGKNLYLIGDDDIIRIDLDKGLMNKLNLRISSSEIHDLTEWQGKLLIALDGGILEIAQTYIRKKNVKPLFSFTGFRVNDQFISRLNGQEFSYDKRDFEISYAIPVFNKQLEVPLYYRINSGKWKTVNPESRTLSLAALSPGEYFIEFRPGNAPFPFPSVRFTIRDPWWKQTGFVLFVIILFVGIVYLIYRWQIRNIQRRNAFISEKMQLETALKASMLRSVKAQMNPHFFYNALNTIQSFIYENDKRNASTYLSKFSKLTRMILEMSDMDKVSLSTELQALRLYIELEEARFNEDFTYELTVDPALNAEHIQIPSMLIQPYVENAVKHGLLHKKGEKQLIVSFTLESENLLKIVIDDNGVGRFRSAEINRLKFHNHKSFASDANMKRLNLLQKEGDRLGIEFNDKTDDSGEPQGTTVTIFIPF